MSGALGLRFPPCAGGGEGGTFCFVNARIGRRRRNVFLWGWVLPWGWVPVCGEASCGCGV